LPAARRRLAWRALQLALGLLVFWYVGRALVRAWRDYQAQSLSVDLSWSAILLSGLAFLATYAVLIATWRAVVQQWGERISHLDAARIWTVASLTRYLPFKLWQIPVMAAMARRANVSPVAAAGSAIIGTVVNIAAGFVLALALGPRLLEAAQPGSARVGIVLLAVGVAGLASLPWLMPRFLHLASRATGRTLDVGALPMRAIVLALTGNIVAWMMYGWAFRTFAVGMLGQVSGSGSDWMAAWAISYVIGYIFLFLPAGVGAREGALLSVLPAAGLTTPAQAALLAVGSRLWLTILEIAPGLVFLASGAFRRRSSPVGPQDDPR
jgi:hypothetical protein